MLDLIYREITTLGLVEFCLYLVHKYVDSINYEVEGDYSLFMKGKLSSSSLKLSLGSLNFFPRLPLSFSLIRGCTFHVILYRSIQCHPRLLNSTPR